MDRIVQRRLEQGERQKALVAVVSITDTREWYRWVSQTRQGVEVEMERIDMVTVTDETEEEIGLRTGWELKIQQYLEKECVVLIPDLHGVRDFLVKEKILFVLHLFNLESSRLMLNDLFSLFGKPDGAGAATLQRTLDEIMDEGLGLIEDWEMVRMEELPVKVVIQRTLEREGGRA